MDPYHTSEARASRELLIPPVEKISRTIQELRLRRLGEKSLQLEQQVDDAFHDAEEHYDSTDKSTQS